MANGIIVDQGHSDQELMEDPSDWTSIAEQYGPFQDDLDIEVYNFVILRRIKTNSHGHFKDTGFDFVFHFRFESVVGKPSKRHPRSR